MRAMALLLLLLVAYGATVEVVHKHGNSGKGYAAATSSTKVVDKEGSAATDARTSGACLICQLHQNLFTSLFNAQPKLVAPPALVARTTVQPTSYLSQMDAPRRGRAPPFTSPL
ncbi:MAG: hypothetical protein QOF02_2106 [Blastocatellia bacterium]|jgi:hypothetical protein|nr:hypothetical protein [Blastocatellia bacterium]